MSDYVLEDASSHIPTNSGFSPSHFLRGIITRFIDSAEKAAERRRAIAKTRELARMNDHILRDIGVTRGAIDYALLHGRVPERMRRMPGSNGLSFSLALTTMTALTASAATAGGSFDCTVLPDHAALLAALETAVETEASGLDLQMWATIVDRDGRVCAVAASGSDRGAQWPGSRVISAQKANTANAFSLDGLALSTANLFSAVQPGGSLFGLQLSNPVNTSVAYQGPAANYGTAADPMVGGVVGGVNVFGGGLGLYDETGVVGAVGLSGDTSCADHMIAWRVRHELGLDKLATAGTGGVSGDNARPDNIVYDIAEAGSAEGFGHPKCINTGDQTVLPTVN